MRVPLLSMALAASALVVSLGAGAAAAQTAGAQTPGAQTSGAQTSGAPTPGAVAHPHTRMTLKEHFAQANTSNDGHLTLDQAKQGLPRVAKHFAAIDKDNKGYVTLTDIQDYYKAQRAARRQAPGSTSG